MKTINSINNHILLENLKEYLLILVRTTLQDHKVTKKIMKQNILNKSILLNLVIKKCFKNIYKSMENYLVFKLKKGPLTYRINYNESKNNKVIFCKKVFKFYLKT